MRSTESTRFAWRWNRARCTVHSPTGTATCARMGAPEYFKTFTVHPDFRTLVWLNGADLAPEFLHDAVRVTT